MLQRATLQWDDIVIYRHPETNKHLGIARIILRSPRQMKICIEKFNNKSVMGKIITVFHDAYGEECKNLVEALTTEKKVPVVPVIQPPVLLPFVPEATKIPPVGPEFNPLLLSSQEIVEDRRWSGKHRDKDYNSEWESTNYNSHSRSSSVKHEEDYSRSSKYYDKYEGRKDRDREYSGKYAHHSSYRGDDYERDRHKRDKNDNRRDRDREYGNKYAYHSSYRDEEYDRSRHKREKDNHRYPYGSKSYSSSEAYKLDSTEIPGYPSSTYNNYNYSFAQSSSSTWAPPPPSTLPEDSPPRPPPEPSTDENDESEKDDSLRNKTKPGDDDETTVDLDTRIAMLFKSKSFGSDVPSLFQLNEDSDTEKQDETDQNIENKNSDESYNHKASIDGNNEQNEIELAQLKIKDEPDRLEDGEITEVKKTPEVSDDSSISTVPSPYVSRSVFSKNRKFYKNRKLKRQTEKVKVESGASDISSSEDELLAKGSYSPPLPPGLKNDEMSLSSLSSTEPIKEEIVSKSMRDLSTTYPVGFSSYDAAYYYQNSFHQFQQPNHWMASGEYDASAYYNQYKKVKPEDTTDPHEVAVKKVIDKLILELRQILKKDFNKRMIENTAFKKYEAWWDDQERNKNTRSYHDKTEATVSSIAPEPSMKETYQQNVGMGILRNLRFQRIKRKPAPVQEEDSRKSDPDDDDMVHGSDSEKEDVQQESKTSTSYINRKVVASSSSESSESSDSSSDDDAEEEEKDDHVYSSDTASILSDDELTIRKTPSKKETENSRIKAPNIYSDSDSDIEEEAQAPKPLVKPKLKIYSESDEEDEPAPPGTSSKDESQDQEMKSPESKVSHAAQPAESDSDFFNDDVISKPPRTPGRSSSDEQVEKEKVKSPKKPTYSDSDEEREYQEKIRRNTEWMEQIERETKEKMERQRLVQEDKPPTTNELLQEPSVSSVKIEPKKISFDEPFTPKATLPPPTPGANLKLDPFALKADQDLGKKKRGRPKGSVGKTKEPKKVKNGATNKIGSSFFAQPQPSSKPDLEEKYSLRLSPFSSSDGGSSQASLVALEHCYSLPPSASPSLSSSPHDHQDIHMDHDYCGKSDVIPLQSIQPGQLDEQSKKEHVGARPVGRPRKDPNAPKAQYTKKDKSALVEKIKSPKEKIKKFDLKQHQTMVENFVPIARYNKRSVNDQTEIVFRFVTHGIDQEDLEYMRRAYSYLIQNDIPGTELLHQVHWVDHCATDLTFTQPPSKKRRRDNDYHEMKQHVTGCARTEGYYKIDSKDKAHYKYHHLRGTAAGSHIDNAAKMAVAKMQNASREARSNQRRLLTAFGGATESDLLKFNQLKFRKKQLKFAKSAIHDWGLFAMEPIAADEMVIEYVGQMVRPSVADLRESKYEAIGIGSSYLFRIDLETIIDATKCGNLARFINHSCNVSLYNIRN